VRRFEGKVTVIAGGATGIGAETARRLASEGAQVVVGDVNLAGAQATVAGIRQDGGEAVVAHFDLADEASVAALVETAMNEYGGLDGLVNVGADTRNETVAADSDLVDIDIDHFEHVLRVDLRGYLLCCRHAIPRMLERGGGAIVCTTSDGPWQLAGRERGVAYASAKLGMVALVRHIVARWGREGIRCNCVSPGHIVHEQVMRVSTSVYGDRYTSFEDLLEDKAAISPSGRVGRPSDIAATVAFLLSDDGVGINAQVIHVNGGWILGW
jgi:NAD(P)-dependent dehydrogenase (short-subunit alcohol dehydrogenase family)